MKPPANVSAGITRSLGWAIFLLAIGLPALAILARCALDFRAPTDGFNFTARQMTLLAKTFGLAAMAALLALIISIPAAFVVGQIGRLDRRPMLAALVAAPLLLPPTVYVFGWQRLLPPTFPGWIACVGAWALWTWPIPALLIGNGWAALGRSAFETALLDAPTAAAFRRAALPLLSRHVTLAVLVLLVLFIGDYGVPHAWAIPVYSTELLGWAASSHWAIDTLWPSLPCVAVLFAGVFGISRAWRRCAAAEVDSAEGSAARTVPSRWLVAATVTFAVAVIVPVGALVLRMGSPQPMRTALETYPGELAGSLAVAGMGGILAMLMGVCLGAAGRFRQPAILAALAFGALPGGLVGEALLIAYRPVPALYDSWLMPILGYVARFGWIGALVASAAMRGVAEECAAQARTDGADETRVALHIRAAASWPTLLSGACLVAALSLAEIPTSSLVHVPSLGLISQILMEKFHKAEDGMLIALSLWLVLAVFPAAGCLMVGLRGRSHS